MADYGKDDRERQDRERRDRERNDKEREGWQRQSDDQVEVIKRSIDTIKVKVPQDVKGELDNLLQAVQSLVAHYKNQPTQLPADPNNPSASQPIYDPNNPQAGQLPSGQQPGVANPIAPGGRPQPK